MPLTFDCENTPTEELSYHDEAWLALQEWLHGDPRDGQQHIRYTVPIIPSLNSSLSYDHDINDPSIHPL